jgi:hypothetical protein
MMSPGGDTGLFTHRVEDYSALSAHIGSEQRLQYLFIASNESCEIHRQITPPIFCHEADVTSRIMSGVTIP